MYFCDAGSGRAAELAARTGGEAVDSLAELAEVSDAILLAVKPASLETAATQLGGRGDAIASVLAGCVRSFPACRSCGRCRRSRRRSSGG